jgi:phosphoribosyl 1,2-cyclic phosphodiesterase
LDALLLEANHDTRMLAEGPYPPALQARVGGDYGHLNNQQAAELLKHIQIQPLQHLVIAHLSEKNNDPTLAEQALCAVDGVVQERLSILQQDEPSSWYVIE